MTTGNHLAAPWPRLSTASKERLSSIVARVMEPADLNHRTTLVSPTEAQELIDAIEARQGAVMRPADAAAAAKTLMGLFPAKAFNDPEIFATGLTANFAASDPEFVKAVCHPVTGLATRLKYALSLADVAEALEAEKRKRLSLLSRARWTLREHKRRAEEEMRDFKLSPQEAERRRRQVATLLGPKEMEQGEPVNIETEERTNG